MYLIYSTELCIRAFFGVLLVLLPCGTVVANSLGLGSKWCEFDSSHEQSSFFLFYRVSINLSCCYNHVLAINSNFS